MIDCSVIIPSYNANETLPHVISSIKKQISKYTIETIVIDDFSEPPIYLLDHSLPNLKTHRNSMNQGLSFTRNKGAEIANGKVLVFIDSDCEIKDNISLQMLIKPILEDDIDVTLGIVSAKSNDFWGEYQRETYKKRAKSDIKQQSTAFFAIKKSSFEKLGGYNVSFTQYGFEDQDFILRAIALNLKILLLQHAITFHLDNLLLNNICQKMFKSGKFSSNVMFQNHQQYYLETLYGKIDAKHTYLGKVLSKFPINVSRMAKLLDTYFLSSNRFFRLKSFLVKLLSAIAYAKGTSCETDFIMIKKQ